MSERDWPDRDADSLLRYVGSLETIARRLRVIGTSLLGFTVANLFLLLPVALGAFSSSLAVQYAALLFVAVLGSAVLFESSRRRGEVIYGEVSDEIHRRTARNPNEEVGLEFRIALRDFATSMDLPLVPGRLGAAVYVVFNLALVLTILFLRKPLY